MNMKQEITIEQFNELPNDKMQKLNKWQAEKGYLKLYDPGGVNSIPQVYYLPMTIGMMIEFLDESDCNHKIKYIEDNQYNHVLEGFVAPTKYTFGIGWNNDLCDSLWEFVKVELK